MKRFEFTLNGDGLSVRRESEQRLTAEQKFIVILTVIICTSFLGFVYLVSHA